MKLFVFDVRIHMKSGAVLKGIVTNMTKHMTGNGLSSLKWDGTMPFYFKLDDVTAVEVTRRLNWRRLFRNL